VCAEDSNELIDLVVIRLQILIGDRPVVAKTVERLALKIVRAEPQGDPPPMVRASAEHARSEPVELVSGRGRVRFTLDRPAAKCAVEFAELPLRNRRAAPRCIVRPLE